MAVCCIKLNFSPEIRRVLRLWMSSKSFLLAQTDSRVALHVAFLADSERPCRLYFVDFHAVSDHSYGLSIVAFLADSQQPCQSRLHGSKWQEGMLFLPIARVSEVTYLHIVAFLADSGHPYLLAVPTRIRKKCRATTRGS